MVRKEQGHRLGMAQEGRRQSPRFRGVTPLVGFRGGFTLIELLVVIAIIAILAAILFPVFSQARTKARQASDLSNLRQMGTAVQMYCQDYDEFWVPIAIDVRPGIPGTAVWWPRLIYDYVRNAQIFRSPQFAILYTEQVFNWFNGPAMVPLSEQRGGMWVLPVSYQGVNAACWLPPHWRCTNTAFLDDPAGGCPQRRHYGMFFREKPGTGSLAEVVKPAETRIILNGINLDAWHPSHFDIVGDAGDFVCGFTTVVYNVNTSAWWEETWSINDADRLAPFLRHVNVTFSDGHAKAMRWGTACPHEFTVQDDKLVDPLPRCRQ